MAAEQEHRPESSGRPGPDELPPGAERFWGQFSQARSGRSHETGDDRGGDPEGEHRCLEWCPICRSAELLRSGGGGTGELRTQLLTLQDEIAHVLRAFAEAYAERAAASDRERGRDGGEHPGPDAGARPGGRVTDIDIE